MARKPATYRRNYTNRNEMKRPATTRLNVCAATAVAVVCLLGVVLTFGHYQGAIYDDKKSSKDTASASFAKALQPTNGADALLTLTPAELRDAQIRTEALQPSSVNESVGLTGTVSVNQDRIAKVVPRLPGRISSVPAALGAQEIAGQTLAVLERAGSG